ncbi:MAG: co-chaperone GroES [Candidatus Pacebacteria bacterium]|nr:co-chaperone GroES [Candidatus Paceibacterota bacterium]
MKIKPLSNNVVVELIKEEEKAKERIFLLQSGEKEKLQQGKVIFVGSGKITSQGKNISMQVKKGDIVLFNRYRSHEIKAGDKDYLVIVEDDIIAVIE